MSGASGGGLTALRALDPARPVDLEELLQSAVDEVVRLLGADRGTLYLIDHARQELVSRVAHLPELSEIRLRLGEGIAGTVASRGETLNVPVGTGDPRFAARIDQVTGYVTRSLLATPVREPEGGAVGVLQVLNKREGTFSGDDARRLEALAAELGELLRRTSLWSQLQPGQQHPLGYRFNHILGESPPMREVYDKVARAARTEATVLLCGESGTGKELIARAVHWNSPRREGPFVKVDCAALPEALIENELFGHERGAFTGADRAAEGKVHAAGGGTLFLDEVGELPLHLQGKLLRLLQEKTYLRVGGTEPQRVDARFVAATHRDLAVAVAEGRFRADLYYRLRVVQLDLPPLRARGAADLDRLVDHFLFHLQRRHGRPELRLLPAARAALHGHDWPGNVRELEHCLESAVVLAPGPAIEPGHLPLPARAAQAPPAGGDVSEASPAPAALPPDTFVSKLQSLAALERDYLRHVLAACQGNKSQAARVLEISRNTLIRKLKEQGDEPAG